MLNLPPVMGSHSWLGRYKTLSLCQLSWTIPATDCCRSVSQELDLETVQRAGCLLRNNFRNKDHGGEGMETGLSRGRSWAVIQTHVLANPVGAKMFLQSCASQDVQALVLIIMYLLLCPSGKLMTWARWNSLNGLSVGSAKCQPLLRPFFVGVSVCICVNHSVACSFCSRDHILTSSPSLFIQVHRRESESTNPSIMDWQPSCGLGWLSKESHMHEAGWALAS